MREFKVCVVSSDGEDAILRSISVKYARTSVGSVMSQRVTIKEQVDGLQEFLENHVSEDVLSAVFRRMKVKYPHLFLQSSLEIIS